MKPSMAMRIGRLFVYYNYLMSPLRANHVVRQAILEVGVPELGILPLAVIEEDARQKREAFCRATLERMKELPLEDKPVLFLGWRQVA